MEKVKIYPKLGEDVGSREVLYIVCKAEPEDKANTYSVNSSKRKSIGEKGVECFGVISGAHLATFTSIASAAKKLDIDPSNISKAANGKIPTAGDFRWEFTKKRKK